MSTKKRKNKSIVKLREKKISNDNVSLFLEIYQNGKRKYEFLKLYLNDKPSTPEERQKNKDNLALAESIRSKRENEIKSTEYGFIPAFKSKINFFEYFQEYVDNYQNKDVRLVVAALKHFKAFVGTDHILAKDISEDLLIRFKKHLDDNFNGETPHNYFKKLKKVLKQAHKDRLMLVNPAADITNTRTEGLRKDVLSFEEIQLLANTDCGNPEVKRAFLFCLNTGLRHSEVKNLSWKNIKNEKIIIRSQGKTKKPVYIDLNNNARLLLGERKKPNELVFNLPSSLNGCNKTLKTWVKKAEIEKHITWHCARHSFGVNLIIQNANMKTIAGLMGHTSTRQTEIYTRFVDELKKQAVDSLPDLSFDI